LVFLSALLFNGGQALLEVFGLNPDGILDGQFDSALIVRVLRLVLGGLAGLHCGAVIALYRSRGERRRAPSAEPHSRLVAVRTIGWCLLALSVVPNVLALRDAFWTVQSSGYLALFQQAVQPAGFASAPLIIAEFVAPGIFLLLAAGRRLEVRTAAAVLLVYAAIALFLGLRGSAVVPLVAAAWLWDRCGRRLPRSFLVVIGVALLIAVFPLVRETRVAPGKERSSASYLAKSYSEIENPLVSTLSEMGKSMITIAFTLELVPRERAYDMGGTYAYGLLTVMPSLFWDRHPAVVHGVPSSWLVETVDPYLAAQGGGIGYSFIAEEFLNFGALGPPLISLLIGYLFGRFCLWAERGSAARLAVMASFLPHLLFFARGDFSDLPRALVWYGLGPYAACLLLERSLRTRELSTRRLSTL
jgi:oligosaccharide repeat unit polymerase